MAKNDSFKILLTRPPAGKMDDSFSRKHVFPPLGLAYLAAYIEDTDFVVKIMDPFVEGWTFTQTQEKINAFEPDLVGISFTTENRFEAFQMAKVAKKAAPNAVVVAGGPHPSLTVMDTLTNIPEIDIIVIGEGEVTFRKLCETLDTKGDLSKVNGIAFRKDGKIKVNERGSYVKNINKLSRPARHLLPMNKYSGLLDLDDRQVPAESIMTSRGCPIGCYFCATTKMSGGVFRARSAKNVFDEIKFIVDTYGRKNFWFFDDAFTWDLDRVVDICDRIINAKLNINWVCQSRVDVLTKELLQKMSDAGCVQLRFGVESGSQEIVDKVVRKKITLDKVEQVSRWCEEVGIQAHASFIVSHDGETYVDARKTMTLMKKLEKIGTRTSYMILKIYPGTLVALLARKKNIVPPDFTWTKHYDAGAIHKMPFLLGNVPYYQDKLTLNQITSLVLEWAEMRKIVMWKRIPSILLSLRDINDVRNVFSIGKSYVRNKLRF
ncbi:B12-binding domain-containing radical SAM protein [Candidatus Woesearchaeota archaeon]|jgi:anaerobic magnesium-protoporphyrin IX monomethyl ester cyclase|nr:B12-binding domain-containing radical SAM protein [Candidatus Woesearchaeota archaeon]MBT4114298.1 B12-binding domain-containing radical SAM protein [Candidatus Woesearchaeota archaeon]MBT4248442.1 B12-binding domain-containing radical SAM protein [Candidatus Woesearchaeota archaeon]